MSAIERGEYDAWLCPLNLNTFSSEDGDAEFTHGVINCRARLHLSWTLDCSLSDAEPDTYSLPWGDCSQWEVNCENGHTLAVSAGDENAEPFDPATFEALFPAPTPDSPTGSKGES